LDFIGFQNGARAFQPAAMLPPGKSPQFPGHSIDLHCCGHEFPRPVFLENNFVAAPPVRLPSHRSGGGSKLRVPTYEVSKEKDI
jgi:hypothetical protein